MEVLVGFLQGDPDQPVVLGCLPNAVQPLPFRMLTKSGMVSRSTPSGKIQNEVSFEDRQGAEELAIHAGRDLVVTSARHARTTIGGANRTEVFGLAETHLGSDHKQSVGGDSEQVVQGNAKQRVELGWTRSTQGELTESAGGDYHLSVGKGCALTVNGILSTSVGTAENPSVANTFVHGDHITHSSGSVRIVADAGIQLVSGENRIEITKDGVRITATKVDVTGKEGTTLRGAGPSLSLSDVMLVTAKKIQLFAEKGHLLLDEHARMKGETVKLNCSDEEAPPVNEDGTEPEMEPFRTKLTDHSFAPYKNRTYHVVAGGLRFEGTTTADGFVEKEIPKGAKVIEITVWIGEYPEGERRVFHIRRGAEAPDTAIGAQGRLANLGYLKGALSGSLDDATRSALVSFQLDSGLPATGELDAKTVERLTAIG